MDHSPLDCIREMTRLARAGEWMSLPFWVHETELQAWVLETLQKIKDQDDGEEPVFGSAAEDDAVIECLRELCESLGCELPARETYAGAKSNIILQMLLSALMKWLVEAAENGELAEIIRKLLEQFLS